MVVGTHVLDIQIISMCRLDDVTTTELLHDCWCYALVAHWAEESQCNLSSGVAVAVAVAVAVVCTALPLLDGGIHN